MERLSENNSKLIRQCNRLVNEIEKIRFNRSENATSIDYTEIARLANLENALRALLNPAELQLVSHKYTANQVKVFYILLPYIKKDPESIINLCLASRFCYQIMPAKDRKEAIAKTNSHKSHRLTLHLSDHHITELVIKTCLIGDVATGKTTLLNAFCKRNKNNLHSRAALDIGYCQKTYDINGVKLTMKLYDLEGTERFGNLLGTYYNNTQIYCILFRLSCFNSYLAVEKWRESIAKAKNPDDNAIIVVLAHRWAQQAQHSVTPREIKRHCCELSIQQTHEIDAKEDFDGVDRAMEAALCQYLKRYCISNNISINNLTLHAALIYMGLTEYGLPKDIIVLIFNYIFPTRVNEQFQNEQFQKAYCLLFFNKVDKLIAIENRLAKIWRVEDKQSYFFPRKNRINHFKMFVTERIRTYYQNKSCFLLTDIGKITMQSITEQTSGELAFRLAIDCIFTCATYYSRRAIQLQAKLDKFNAVNFSYILMSNHLRNLLSSLPSSILALSNEEGTIEAQLKTAIEFIESMQSYPVTELFKEQYHSKALATTMPIDEPDHNNNSVRCFL